MAAAAAGGNAVDAAIAAMVAAMTTEPGIVSVAGGAFVTIWPAGGEPEVVDGNVEMPGRGMPSERFGEGLREIHTTYGGGLTLYAGHGSVATPGALAALGVAHDRHGQAAWKDVMAPSVAAARSGYRVGAAAACYLAITGDSVFGWDAHTRPLVTGPDGGTLSAGDLATNPDLADTLEQVVEEGARSMYTGSLAALIATDSEQRGGLVTAADLAAYRPQVRTPLRLQLGDWDVATNPPPSVGGPMLAVMLRELAGPPDWDWARIIEVQRQVLSYRHRVHDLSTDLEEDGYALLETVERHGLAGLPTSSSTAHVSAVGQRRYRLRDHRIERIRFRRNGSWHRNAAQQLSRRARAQPARPARVWRPGTRLASNMAPSAARRSDGAALAVGSPGADRITTALMQVLGRLCLHGDALQHAIDAPRVHVRILDDGTRARRPRGRRGGRRGGGRARAAVVLHGPQSMFFGGVGAAASRTASCRRRATPAARPPPHRLRRVVRVGSGSRCRGPGRSGTRP